MDSKALEIMTVLTITKERAKIHPKGGISMGLFKLNVKMVAKMKVKRDVKGLIKALRNKDGNVRREAAWALGDIGDVRAVEHLIDTLKDERVWFRKLAIDALRKIKDERAVEPLKEAMKDKDNGLRRQAAWALLLLEKISSDEYNEMFEPCQPTEGSVRSILRALKDNNRFIREEAEKGLEKIEKHGGMSRPLIQALKDKDNGLRRRVIKALGNIGDANAVEPLIEALKDKDAGVRKGAAIALEKLGDARAVAPLLECMFANPDSTMEQEVKALSKMASSSNLTEEIIRIAAEAAEFKTSFYEGRGDDPSEYREYSNRAVKKLCSNKSPLVANILILISQRNDISVTMYSGLGDRSEEWVALHEQRQVATNELARRGSPPYDPSAFLKASE